MQTFLDEVAIRHPYDKIIMILDGACWHRRYELKVSNNIRLARLPPYSPELNPVEHIWDDLKEKYFHNRVFDSIDALEDHLEEGLRNMENDPTRIHSIVAWPWIINALYLEMELLPSFNCDASDFRSSPSPNYSW